MYRSFDSYDPTRRLGPWVARITYNVCLRQREGVVRRATNLVTPDTLNGYPDGAMASPEHHAARREADAHLGRAMAVLSPEDRALVTMRYREGLSDAEVAGAADMPVNTVKTRIFRARARLRKALKPLLGEETS